MGVAWERATQFVCMFFSAHLLSNGDQYEGDWVAGNRHGQGILRCIDSTVYDVSTTYLDSSLSLNVFTWLSTTRMLERGPARWVELGTG